MVRSYCFVYQNLVQNLFLRFVSAGVSAEFVSAVSAVFLRSFCGASAEDSNHVPKVALQRFVSASKFEVNKFLYKI